MISRCSAQERMSKTTFLAIMRAQNVVGIEIGQVVTYIDSSGRNHQVRVVSVFTDTVRIELNGEVVEVGKDKIQTPSLGFFDKLQNEDWSITSFDPRSRVVCIRIDNGKVIENISVTIPITVGRNN